MKLTLGRYTNLFLLAILFHPFEYILAEDNPDLSVCQAYSDRIEQLSCCAEFGITEKKCTVSTRKPTDTIAPQPDSGAYFFCKFSNLDGSGRDIAKWGKGTDFKYIPSRKVWEWRTKYTVQTIDVNGRYYQKALQPIFDDQIGECGSVAEREYTK